MSGRLFRLVTPPLTRASRSIHPDNRDTAPTVRRKCFSCNRLTSQEISGHHPATVQAHSFYNSVQSYDSSGTSSFNLNFFAPTTYPFVHRVTASLDRARTLSHRIFLCIGCISVRGRDFRDQLPPPHSPVMTHPDALKLTPDSSAKINVCIFS